MFDRRSNEASNIEVKKRAIKIKFSLLTIQEVETFWLKKKFAQLRLNRFDKVIYKIIVINSKLHC